MILKLSLKNVLRNKRRTAITVAVVAVGASMLILALAYIEFIKWGLRERTIHGDTGHFQVVTRASLEKESGRILQYGIEGWQDLVAELENQDEVELAAPEIEFSGLATTGEKSFGVFVAAVVPGKKISLGSGFVDSEPYEKLRDDPEGIVLGQGLAELLNAKIGDYITLMTTTVDGALNAMDFKMLGTVTTFTSEMDKRYAIIGLEGVQNLLGTRKVEKVLVGLYDTKELPLAAKKAQAILGEELCIRYWYEVSPYYNKVLQFFNQLVGFLAPILMIVVWFSTMNTVLMSILERSAELATLRTLGTSKPTLVKMLVMEGLWIGIIGVALGFVLELVLAHIVNRANIMLPPPPGQTSAYPLLVRNIPGNFVFVGVLTLAVTAFSTILPALRILKLNIVTALRR